MDPVISARKNNNSGWLDRDDVRIMCFFAGLEILS
jgi:hypothetical protein